MMTRAVMASAVISVILQTAAAAHERFKPPGDLLPDSGKGVVTDTIFYPRMRFPIEQGPAYASSHFYGVGGTRGPEGDSCDEVNYSYPWHDNFCEYRKSNLPLCPSGGHQGQDLRPATCRANYYWAVAAEDGVIAQIGRFGVTLQTPDGTLYRYDHLNTHDLAVHELDKVSRGDRIGKISNNWLDRLPIHLHFDAKDAVLFGDKTAVVFVPPYSSLVQSYVKLMDSASTK